MSSLLLHPYQNALIKRLALAPPIGLSFNECLLADISSDHSNYHLKQLIRFGLVQKKTNTYSLTDKGKEYSGSLNLDDRDQPHQVIEYEESIALAEGY